MRKRKWIKEFKVVFFWVLLSKHKMIYDYKRPRYKSSREGCHYADFGTNNPIRPLFEGYKDE